MVVREPAAVPSRHRVQDGAVFEALGQGLAAPAVVDRQVLVEVAYEDPLQATISQTADSRSAGSINHRDFVDYYKACGLADGFVGEMFTSPPFVVLLSTATRSPLSAGAE